MLQVVQRGFPETPFDSRVDRSVLPLDQGLHTIVELVQVALERGGEKGNDVHQSSSVEGVEVSRPRGGELHEADQLALDVKRIDEQATVSMLPKVVLVAGAYSRLLQILHDDRVGTAKDGCIMGTGPVWARGGALVTEEQAPAHRPRTVDGINVRSPVEGDKTEAELRATQEVANATLEPIDLFGRRHRILLDEVVLESRNHLVRCHVHGGDHRHPIELEGVWRESLSPQVDVGRLGQQACYDLRRRLFNVPNEPDRNEPWIDAQREVPVQPNLLIADGHDHRVLEVRLDSDPLLEQEFVGPHELPEEQLVRRDVQVLVEALTLAEPESSPTR